MMTVVDNNTAESPAAISATVLDEVRRELSRYEENAEAGTTFRDAAADVVQRLHDLYCVTPVERAEEDAR